MIQFNLLPDIKLEYIKAERTKRLVITVASLVSAAALALLIILAVTVYGLQKKHMNDLTADISSYTKEIKGNGDIDKVLTVQNQLNSLTGLHEQKQDTTRVFPFIQQITPSDVSISTLTLDFEAKTIIITGASNATGSANRLASVNKFVDTLKFTDYKEGDTTAKAFSDVVLTSFGRAETGATYSISATFDETIFSNTKTVTLQVPTQVTTRSETEKPSALFDAAPQTGGGQ